jgi:DNA-binding transcriptional MerR regulator
MPKKDSGISEQKLQLLVDNWKDKSIPEMAELLGITETTLGFWVMKLRKSMRAAGMPPDRIAEMLPSKRKAPVNVFDAFAVAGRQPEMAAPKKRTRSARKKKSES